MFAYLDSAATTNVLKEAADAAYAAMMEGWSNPSSRYPSATAAAKQVAEGRAAVAQALGCSPKELVFTSCGTESDNWALRAGLYVNRRKGKHLITTAIEHSAILETCKQLEKEGYEVTYLQPTAQGNVSLDELAAALREDTVLVSMMLVNNELGTVLPVKEACALVKRFDRKILFHCDAVQGFLKVPFTPRSLGVDLLSISAHKIHGPKGIGAMYIRSGLSFPALITGGGQENGLRSGTEATSQIAAFGVAAKLCKATFRQDIAHMEALKQYTLAGLAGALPQVEVIAQGEAPHILALTLPGYKAEVLVRVLGDNGVCVSAGSACHRGKPSHVYAAMGLTKPQRDGAFRISFDRSTTVEEVDYFVEQLVKAKAMLFPTMS
ncbi:MAG: cysteine desulfurase [Oscillospiraceae bacterium]|nr:cysteine desulfurase [Oscillospiraceae bacterium]